MTENAPLPDPALQDLANVVAASEALARLTQIGGPLWGSDEADQIKRMLPRLARKTVAATRRALHFQVPAVIEVPAVDPLLERVADMSLREARAVFETAFLARQVVRHKGNLSSAADFCGMERSAFYRKLRGLGIIGTFEREPGRTRHRKRYDRTPR